MIIRGFLFYNKGIKYIEKYGEMPKLNETQYVVFGVGLLIPWFISILPFISYVSFLFVIVVFVNILSRILTLNDFKKTKPEAMAMYGIGLGAAGTLGFILGCLREINDKKENIEEKKE